MQGASYTETHTPLTQRSREWAHYAFQALWWNLSWTETNWLATRQGTLGHSRLSLVSHCGLILPKEWNLCARWMNRPTFPKNLSLTLARKTPPPTCVRVILDYPYLSLCFFIYLKTAFTENFRLSCKCSKHSLIPSPLFLSWPSRGGNVAVYVTDINQPSFATPFYFLLGSKSVFVALSTVFHSINSPDNSPLSHCVLPVLFLPYWPFQLYISYESHLALI